MAWITFSYDDGLKSNYDTMLPLHEKYNIPASLAIISDRAINPIFWDKYMTAEQVVDTDKRGHEIVSHGVHHKTKFTELSDIDLNNELSISKETLNKLVNNEISAINIPFATYNDKVLEQADKYYKQIRLAGDKYNNTNEKSNIIYAFAINSKSTIERVKKLIDKAVENKLWLVLMFHDITDENSPKGMYSNTKNFLEQALSYTQKYIQEDKLAPKLFRDVLQFKKVQNHEKLFNKKHTLAEKEGFLITYHPANQPTDKLLISFGGFPSTKTPKGFGSNFAMEMDYHHIFVAQKAGSQYQLLSLEEFKNAVMPVCKDKDVFTYGSSLGGYCAIYYAGVINAQAISAAPKNSAHPTLTHNLKHYVHFNHDEFVDTQKSNKSPIIIYDPHQREESRFIKNLIIPAYPKANLIKVPYSGHLVLQVMSNHGLLKNFITKIINEGEITSINYNKEQCHIWNFEQGRVLVRDGRKKDAIFYLKRSIELNYTEAANKLIQKTS